MAREPDIEPVETVVDAPAKPKSYRMHILIGLICIALLQTTILYLMIPKPSKVMDDIAKLRPEISDIGYNVDTGVVPDGEISKEPTVEKPIGEKIRVQDIRKGPDQTIDAFTVTIHVQVYKKDESAFDKLNTERQNAIRDAVTEVLRGTTLEERSEVSLQIIRRKIMKRINEVLGTPYVRGVLCTDPSVDTM
jgi:flagellar basal body-associated protein FliL